ncbi:MAG: DegT/DnrJ/EryC1/StrS family aminotransferase [Bacteroidales bacterium]|nr:DegT/DnrJ/EryC1/StrS family aminotransferase [Bacteroidales bacterium]
MNKNDKRFKEQIASVLDTDPQRIHLYWKGRVALFAMLKAAGIKAGDEVIIPGFTCVVVPNAIIYSGAIPVYTDIQRKSLNPSFEDIRGAVTQKTRVIVLQNTFGLSSDLELITEWAAANGVLTIEDCTHGFGGKYKGRPNGTFCDAAFFSTQWNKPFSTGIGGFSAVFNTKLQESLTEVAKSLILPGWYDDAMLRGLIMSRKYLLTPATYYTLRSFYRLLSKLNLTIGSSSGDELRDPLMPVSYFKAMGKTQVNAGIHEIATLDMVLSLRKKNAAIYTHVLAEHGKYHVSPDLHQNHSFLKYPVLVTNKKKFEDCARRERVDLGDWFVSPLHPVEKDFEKWHLSVENVPVSAYIANHVLNIPTDTTHPERVVALLEKNLDLLL